MGKAFWNSEKLLGMSALFISLTTLVVFIYQTDLIREQQYMSVYPYLNVTNKYSGSLRYEFIIKNEGIGPALIDTVIIASPKGKYYIDFADYVDEAVPTDDSIIYSYSNLTAGRLIPANKEVSLIKLINDELLIEMGVTEVEKYKNTLADAKLLYRILNHDSLKFTIVYKSIYGEKWMINESSNSPIKQ